MPVIPLLLDQGSERQAGLVFLLQNTWVEAWDPRAPDLIAGAVDGRVPLELYGDTHPDPRAHICPYRGLGVFREEDAAFYFGREPDLERLVAAVDLYPLVAIVGASGQGKSSLARAGLIPRLRHGSGGQIWQVATMMPGRDPFLALARALLPLREPEKILAWSKGDIDDEWTASASGWRGTARTIFSMWSARSWTRSLAPPGSCCWSTSGRSCSPIGLPTWPLLEYALLRRVSARSSGCCLTRPIATACEPCSPCAPTIRGEVLSDSRLAARLPDAAVIHLRILGREALETTIRRPAAALELSVPDALVEALLGDVLDQAGDLPLLEFTLQQLWSAARPPRGRSPLPPTAPWAGSRTRSSTAPRRSTHPSSRRSRMPCPACSPPWSRSARPAPTCAAAPVSRS